MLVDKNVTWNGDVAITEIKLMKKLGILYKEIHFIKVERLKIYVIRSSSVLLYYSFHHF